MSQSVVETRKSDSAATGAPLRMYGDTLRPGQEIFELRDSASHVNNGELLRSRFLADGYLLLRGFHSVDRVMEARREVVDLLRRRGWVDETIPLEQAGLNGRSEPWIFTQEEIAGLRAYQELVQHKNLLALLAQLSGQTMATIPHKWLRALPRWASCQMHYDVAFMNRGTHNMITCWMPLGDVPMEVGPLVLCLGSNGFDDLKGRYSNPAEKPADDGFVTLRPLEVTREYGGRWCTTSFYAGDILLFDLFMLHGGLKNHSNTYRITSDTRYYPTTEAPDDRLMDDSG